MEVYSSEQYIIQNLKDAGCDKKQIKELLKLYKQVEKEKIHRILDKHRRNVLSEVHKNEKQIDCIDYFIYQMDRKDEK